MLSIRSPNRRVCLGFYGLLLVSWSCFFSKSRLLSPTDAADDSLSCVEEFGNCVMNRDCCNDLQCITGDWAVTTDSTCLSKRSAALDELSKSNKMELIHQFYKSKVPTEQQQKPSQQITDLVHKNNRSFPHLVARLERKYHTTVDDLWDSTNNQLTNNNKSEL